MAVQELDYIEKREKKPLEVYKSVSDHKKPQQHHNMVNFKTMSPWRVHDGSMDDTFLGLIPRWIRLSFLVIFEF